jgi:hypothetical protein
MEPIPPFGRTRVVADGRFTGGRSRISVVRADPSVSVLANVATAALVDEHRLVPLYPQDIALPQRLVRFHWTPETSRRATAVCDLQRWLADEPGRKALDVSGSMTVPPAGTRLQAVADGVGHAVADVRGDDGLWLFPADGSGRGVRKAVTVGPLRAPRRDRRRVAAGGPGRRHPAVRHHGRGSARAGPGDDAAVTKLNVVTDGEDTTSTRGPDDLLAAACEGKVRVFVITVEGTSCAAPPLESLTADTGGACYAEVPSGVGPRVAAIIDD